MPCGPHKNHGLQSIEFATAEQEGFGALRPPEALWVAVYGRLLLAYESKLAVSVDFWESYGCKHKGGRK